MNHNEKYHSAAKPGEPGSPGNPIICKLFVHKPATSMSTDVISLVEQVQPQVIVHGHIHDDRPNIPGHFNVAWDRHKRLIRMSEIDTLGAHVV